MRYLVDAYLSAMEWVWLCGLPDQESAPVAELTEHERELAEWDAEFYRGRG